MNEILKKRIEEEADNEMSKHYSNGEYSINIRNIQNNFKGAFKLGARFALSHQWISVGDALPENEDWVIVMYDIGLMGVRKGIYVRVNKPVAENLKITHWMSIPKFEPKK